LHTIRQDINSRQEIRQDVRHEVSPNERWTPMQSQKSRDQIPSSRDLPVSNTDANRSLSPDTSRQYTPSNADSRGEFPTYQAPEALVGQRIAKTFVGHGRFVGQVMFFLLFLFSCLISHLYSILFHLDEGCKI